MSEPGDQTPSREDGLTRREVLRRGALVGGAIWAVPVIQSMTPPAFAQAGSARLHYCCFCYRREQRPNKICYLDAGQTNSAQCAEFCSSQGYARSYFQGPSPNEFECEPGAPCYQH